MEGSAESPTETDWIDKQVKDKTIYRVINIMKSDFPTEGEEGQRIQYKDRS
jgi:hypothetical protein